MDSEEFKDKLDKLEAVVRKLATRDRNRLEWDGRSTRSKPVGRC